MGFKVKKPGTKKGSFEYDAYPDSTAAHSVDVEGNLQVIVLNQDGEKEFHGYGPGTWTDVIEGEWVQISETTPATTKRI